MKEQNKDSNTDRLQKQVVEKLVEKYGIDGSKVLFLNSKNWLEPWIPPAELKAIARKHGGFQRLVTKPDKYIPETEQYVVGCELVDADGVEFENFGVASKGESTGLKEQIDEWVLAAGRAASATLADAGFNPLKSNPVVKDDSVQMEDVNIRDFGSAAVARNRDLKRIHALAYEVGLIVNSDNGVDKTKYRQWLYGNFPNFFDSVSVASAGMLTPLERQQVINKLQIASEIEGVKQVA